MRDTIDVLGQALEDVWDNLFLGAGCSLLWLVLTLLVLPAPAATVALVELAQRVHARESPTLGDYWRLVWKRFWLGWRWAAITLPVVVVLGIDFWIAPTIFPVGLAGAMRVIATLALGIWCVILAYSLPLLFRQERESVVQALRNGGVMALHNPVFSLALLLVALLFLWVSLLLIVVNLLAGPVFCAFLATRAVDSRLNPWLAEQSRT
jgi:hypothetical protein